MHRNSFNQKLFSSLNPDSVYQTHFIPTNIQQPEKYNSKHYVTQRYSIKSQEKKQYLSVVSKGKKLSKRNLLKSNKKNTQKKINSVILGGQKKTDISITNSQKSLRSSLCRSCTSLHQKSQIMAQSVSSYNYNTAQPIPIFTRPQCSIAAPNPNTQQLNRIISRKLNLANIQPHQMITKFQKLNKISGQNQQERFGGKLIRNLSSAGRIYFSVGSSIDKKQQTKGQENQTILLTPKFDIKSEQKPKKRRKNAGFIRSASAPKISHQNNPRPQGGQLLSPFQLASSSTLKQLQINKCIQKMSLIRKQIDELQGFLHDRLESTELKTKFMYNPSKPPIKNESISQKSEINFLTGNIDSRINNQRFIYTPVNNFKSLKTQQNQPKAALIEVRPSSLNTNSNSPEISNINSKSQQISQNLPNFHDFYKLKCPTSIYNVNMEKQIITQIASRHIKVNKENQQSVCHHINPLHMLR